MNHKDPKEIKKYGRLVSNFNKELWDKNRFTIVLAASIAKFTQNPDLKQILMDTELKTLVEASPFDAIWGLSWVLMIIVQLIGQSGRVLTCLVRH